MKTIKCNLDICKLYEQTEGIAPYTYYCPLYACITSAGIDLVLGRPVSYNDKTIKTFPFMVGRITVWHKEDNEVAKDVVAQQYSNGLFNEDINIIKTHIIAFAKSMGCDNVEFD